LQHLKTTTVDERTYKLRVREELLPFIILIPNEIDQEHFVGFVAEKTNTPLEAIRHEVQRLRDQANNRPERVAQMTEVPPINTKEAESVAPGRREELIAYLVAAYEVVPSAWQEKVQKLLVDICHTSWEALVDSVSVQKQSEYTFLLERDFHSYNERVQAEELADRLNQLFTMVTTEQIATARARLGTAERAEEESVVATILDELQTLQTARLQTVCSSQDFINLSSLD
jgi:DNA primase